MVDSLAGFLQSPVWSSPVNDYIEQNCVGEQKLCIVNVGLLNFSRSTNYDSTLAYICRGAAIYYSKVGQSN